MTDLQATYQRLKRLQRAERDGYSEQLGLRVHRALSWLNRASHDDDPDGQFIFLWIAFNAAYATEIDSRQSLTEQDTPTVLSVVFDRVYTLRNQLVHGGATWSSSVNRNQMRDCVAILSELVPVVVETMMDHPQTLWGDASFPVVG